jgi:hypothetical protein
MKYTVGWQLLKVHALSHSRVCACVHSHCVGVCGMIFMCAVFHTFPHVRHMASGRINEQATEDN